MLRALKAARAAVVLCLLVSGCSQGGHAVSSAPAPPTCADVKPPATPLLVELTQQPTAANAACLGKVYDNMVAPAWSDLPDAVHAVDPNDRLWQERSIQYGFTPCADCPRPGLDPAMVQKDHPDWILKDAAGNDVHPPGHPTWVMYDISNPLYLQAWADAVVNDLSNTGWTGVFLIDAGNQAPWVYAPINPLTHEPMTSAEHARYLASAMAEVRAGLKTNGFSVAANNAPSNLIDGDQIGSADAVSVGRGFARLSGEQWLQLYTYFEEALDKRVSCWVWDHGPLDRSERIFGLASYLLISDTLFSAYGVDPGKDLSVYDVNPGVPSEPAPRIQHGVYVRSFASGEVAVNPGPLVASVQVSGQTQPVTLSPGEALIEANGKLVLSGP
jgi:hypothetical protein